MLFLDWRFFPVYDLFHPAMAYPGSYSAGLVALSIVVAVGLAFVSLSIRFRFRAAALSRVAATTLAAPIMGFAVAGMHYTAMEAAVFFPIADVSEANMPASPMFLAALVTVFVV